MVSGNSLSATSPERAATSWASSGDPQAFLRRIAYSCRSVPLLVDISSPFFDRTIGRADYTQLRPIVLSRSGAPVLSGRSAAEADAGQGQDVEVDAADVGDATLGIDLEVVELASAVQRYPELDGHARAITRGQGEDRPAGRRGSTARGLAAEMDGPARVPVKAHHAVDARATAGPGVGRARAVEARVVDQPGAAELLGRG